MLSAPLVGSLASAVPNLRQTGGEVRMVDDLAGAGPPSLTIFHVADCQVHI